MYKIKMFKTNSENEIIGSDIDRAFENFFSKNPDIIIKKIKIAREPLNSANVYDGYSYWGYIIYKEKRKTPLQRKKEQNDNDFNSSLFALLLKMVLDKKETPNKNDYLIPLLITMINNRNPDKTMKENIDNFNSIIPKKYNINDLNDL